MMFKSTAFSSKSVEDYPEPLTSERFVVNHKRHLEESNKCDENPRSQQSFAEIIGNSLAIQKVLHEVTIVAPTDSTVLILGETGTGKELIAQAVHRLSRREGQKLVKLNCAAIPSNLLEAELFGHERGAFTGATNQRTGRFEAAHQGTLFLDEIGDLPLELQPKLLRILQEQEFERLGSSRTHKVDVRLVAATHQSLPEKIEEGEFRRDLYYRLNIFPIKLPPLRERREDIASLANYFASSCAAKMQKQVKEIHSQTLKILHAHDYPGNIRELQNIIERAVIRCSDGILRAEELQLDEVAQKKQFANAPPPQTLADFERIFILQTLKESNWQVGGKAGAAAQLGLKRTTLASKMEKLGIGRSAESREFYSG